MKQYIETESLILRDWKESDLPEFIRLNRNEQVMEFYPKTLTAEETTAFYNRIQEELSIYGYGLYAVELKEEHSFIGYVGLHHVTFEIDFAPSIEIGWRLLPEFWNKGYATEAAKACLKYAEETLKISTIYSFTALLNKRSERVIQKIGMRKVKEFNHPLVALNHRLCGHVLYCNK